MSGEDNSGRHPRMDMALIAAVCALLTTIVVALLDLRSRTLLWWSPAVAASCYWAVWFRQAWVACVPTAFWLLLGAAGQAVPSVQLANVALATSIVLLARSRYFDATATRLPAPFLAACSGWSLAAGLTGSLSALSRPDVAWLGPLLLLAWGVGLGVRSTSRIARAAETRGSGRAFWRGFLTFVVVFLLLALLAALLHLPMSGANSGSSWPGAWQAPPP